MAVVKFEQGVYYAQCGNTWGTLHIGTWLLRIGRGRPFVWRLELFTPYRWFRWSTGKRTRWQSRNVTP